MPGIRVVEGRVQEDGAVRRFDRIQLRWLLLAIRNRPSALKVRGAHAQSVHV